MCACVRVLWRDNSPPPLLQGMIAYLAPFLRAFPSAVIHVGSSTAALWGRMHADTLALWGVHPSRVVFGAVVARRAHVLDKPVSGRTHPPGRG